METNKKEKAQLILQSLDNHFFSIKDLVNNKNDTEKTDVLDVRVNQMILDLVKLHHCVYENADSIKESLKTIEKILI